MTHFSDPARIIRSLLTGAVLAAFVAVPNLEAQSHDPISGVAVGPSGPRQAAHAVIHRPDRAGRRHEISVPGIVQINNQNTQHFGTGGNYRYHVSEHFALNLGGTWYAWNTESSLKTEMIARVEKTTMASDSLLLKWDAHLGLEATPIYGKTSVFNLGVAHFGLYLGAGLGVADTRLQIYPETQSGNPRIFGETGLRPTAQLNAGLRVFLGRHLALRFEVRDVITSTEISKINGCTLSELKSENPGSSCNYNAIGAGKPTAEEAIEQTTASVLHTMTFAGSLSVLF